MAKLSTAGLRVLMRGWLSQPEIRDTCLRHHSDFDPNYVRIGWGGEPDMTDLEWHVKIYGAKPGTTQLELEEHIWNMWCNPARWKRAEKRCLGEAFEDYFYETEYVGEWKPGHQQERRVVPSFTIDMVGDSNQQLVEKYFNDPKGAAKCIFRCFLPDNDLADNYRLEVVTTPDDSEVVGWTIVVD